MDIVITYVDGRDPEWQADFASCVGKKALAKRYRDWGTLPYLFRGIDECMPFIENVFLVVARESQVPAWVDRDRVRVVLHSDFIPEAYLPTFNSTAIEMFMHKIEGLAEEFVYFNDDFFPLMPCQPTDFFRDGRAAVSMAYHMCTMRNLFRVHTKRSDRLARKAAGVKRLFCYVRPQHTCAAMLRSACAEVFDLCKEEILSSVSPLRTRQNYNQYLFTDYAYFTGRTFRQRISNQHLSLSIANPEVLAKAIAHPTRKIACINDVEMTEERFVRLHQAMHEAFEARFPNKSKFEKLS